MALRPEVLIGLDAGTTHFEAVAVTADGRTLARASCGHPIVYGADGAAEQDPGESWRQAAAAVRRLAQQVPGLARRTAALAITGPAGGCWLTDEDGDPAAPALSPLDRRAEGLIARWRASGVLAEIARATGAVPDPTSPIAQLAWLAASAPEILDRAASLLSTKDWLYFCCTGERASDPTAAALAFGRTTECHDPLAVLGLEAAWLLPEVVDDLRRQGALGAAAAAATGLSAGTPVVLGPVDRIATGIAAGLGSDGGALGCSSLGARGCHLCTVAGPANGSGASMVSFGGIRFALAAHAAPLDPDWLLDLAEQLLADAGLIGVPRQELALLLEQRATTAAPGAVRVAPAADGCGLLGLSRATDFYDLLRATYESQGIAVRAAYAALGARPREVRITGEGRASPLAAATLAACLDAPVRPLLRAAPAAAGAALVAALGLGWYADPAAAAPDWVEPELGEPVAVDPEMREIYAADRADRIGGAASGAPEGASQIALAPLSMGRIAPVTLRDSSEAR